MHVSTGFTGDAVRIPEIYRDPVCFFGWRGAACAVKPVATIAKPGHAFKDRNPSILRRGAALPLGKSPRPRSGGRGEAGCVVGPAQAAVPAQPREYLSF